MASLKRHAEIDSSKGKREKTVVHPVLSDTNKKVNPAHFPLTAHNQNIKKKPDRK